MGSLWKKIRVVWATTGVVVTIGFVGWSLIAYRAAKNARAALVTDAQVEVARGDGSWRFLPARNPQRLGLLFFPGGLVDPVAYAPLARSAALAGYPALLVELPRRGAFGGADGNGVLDHARARMREIPGVDRWIVAGHSRGGAVASRLVQSGMSECAGLFLIATSHPRDFSLADLSVPVTKLYGSRDGLASPEKIDATRGNLPPSTRWVRIEGGNHSQFAWYGFQPGDRFARIDRSEQQRRTVELLIHTLQEVSRSDGVRLTPLAGRHRARPFPPR